MLGTYVQLKPVVSSSLELQTQSQIHKPSDTVWPDKTILPQSEK